MLIRIRVQSGYCKGKSEIPSLLQGWGSCLVFKETSIRRLVEIVPCYSRPPCTNICNSEIVIVANFLFRCQTLRSRICFFLGANVDVRSERLSTTALMFAVHNRDMPAIHVLLEHGANVRLRNSVGSTAAMMTNDPNILSVLHSAIRFAAAAARRFR